MYDKERQEAAEIERNDFDSRQLFGNQQLVVVSNREPYQHEKQPAENELSISRPVGGLTASLDPMMQQTGGTWIAWGDSDGDALVVDESDCVEVPPEDPQYTLRRVWLSDNQVQGYYYGFSNQVLWPLCHSSLSTVHSEEPYWERYYQTNEQFADAIVAEADEESVIWLHDYHLALAPWFVRRQLGGSPTIMQFWHIPWPSCDVFRACPHAGELLRGLLGNDVLGFHVERYAKNFLECVDIALDDATIDWHSREVFYRGSTTRVEAIQMGVPFDEIREKAASHSRTDFRMLCEASGIDPDTKIAVGVDRLDYTKGIPERLRALEYLWEQYPEWRDSLTYIQKGSGSRGKIQAYQQIQTEIDQEIERINDRFGTDGWQPVRRISEHLTKEELYGLCRHSDVGIVSPIRDGFNLVAEEYAAAQIDEDGVLVLSTQAGAHDMLGESVVSVSPFDVEEFGERLNDALTMSAEERQSRMQRIRETVAANDLQTWLRKNAIAAEMVGRTRGQPIQDETV